MRDISLVLVPDRAAVGEIRGLACLISDITERKRYEEELLRTRMAVDGASDAIGMASLDGEHFYQNRTFGDLLGYTIEDLRGPDGILRAFKDLDAARVLFETIQQGLGWTGEVEMLAKDGRTLTVYVRADAIRDAQGSITSFIGIMTDITKLRTVQQALNIRTTALLESEKRFKTLVESASDAIFIKDNELRYTDVNTVMVSFLDMQLSDIIGKTDKDVFGNDIAVQTRDVESRVLEGQTIETQESLIYKSQPISVDCIRFPLRGSSNEIMGVCGIVREMVYRPQMTSDALSPGDDYLSPAMRSTLSRALIAAKTNSIILLTVF
jgi:PAS domain S-box-containing protein